MNDSASVSVTVVNPADQLPETPSNLTATVNKIVTGSGRNKVVTGMTNLNWNAVNFATSYQIWRCNVVTTGKRRNRVTTCDYSVHATTTSNSYSETLASDQVRYKIVAKNNIGVSSFSNEVSVKP